MESKELCEWDQDHMEDGWGESCDGSFTLESESDILPVSEVKTKESYFVSKYSDDIESEEAQEFIKEFFPDGLPKFTVETEDVKNTPNYLYNNVFVGERLVAKVFRAKGKSGKEFEGLLNKIS